MDEKRSDKLVTQLTPKALEILSKKPFNEQVSYDLPFGKGLQNDKAIYTADEMMLKLNRQGFRDKFGEPYSNVGDFLYALETDKAGLQTDEDTVEDLWDFIGECTRCRLCETRNYIVQSEGNCNARLMFVGVAPGKHEDESGNPFVGPAGQLLTKIIESIGYKREDVFLSNVVRCRPPENRPPSPNEISTCIKFLTHEIAIVRPLAIVTLGITATSYLLDTKLPLSKLRGTFQEFHGIKVMPTIHPAYLLRDSSKKVDVWNDMKKVRDYLKRFDRD